MTMLTVKELIAKLENLPKHYNVYFEDDGLAYAVREARLSGSEPARYISEPHIVLEREEIDMTDVPSLKEVLDSYFRENCETLDETTMEHNSILKNE